MFSNISLFIESFLRSYIKTTLCYAQGPFFQRFLKRRQFFKKINDFDLLRHRGVKETF